MIDLTPVISTGILGITIITSVLGYCFMSNYKYKRQYDEWEGRK